MRDDRRVQPGGEAARKRAAVEMIARHKPALMRTARRFSIDLDDAEDAYQRALEIALTKAPTTDPRDLVRWTQTVTKHEALALRRNRERLLGRGSGDPAEDPVAALPAHTAGPAERAEAREDMARSREALRTLKPAELRALGLLAEGYSYAEIGQITGFSRTKINRVLAEGRDRFRSTVASSEDGSRCRQLRPLLSAFCDREASAEEAAVVREHLRACAHCRATMRTYRAAPGIAAALAPALPLSRSLLERAGDLLSGLGARLPRPSGAAESASQLAAGSGSGGAGIAGLTKLLAVCGAAGGAAACVATGVAPIPLLDAEQPRQPAIERQVEPPPAEATAAPARHESAPEPEPAPEEPRKPSPAEATSGSAEPEAATAGATEYEPPPAPVEAEPAAPAPAPAPSATSGSAAGEFGP